MRRANPRLEVAVRFVRTACPRMPDPEPAAPSRVLAARRDSAAAHALACQLLAEIAGCDAERLQLRFAAGRPPELVEPLLVRRPGLSLSHSDGMALCAAARD